MSDLFELPPTLIAFSYADATGTKQGQIDVCEATFAIADGSDPANPMAAVQHFREWLLKQGYELTTGQTVALMLKSQDGYREFKKKLQLSRTSPQSTGSTPQS